MDSETFGVEEGYGNEVVNWINESVKHDKAKLEVRLYGQILETKNFGSFEMFSWIGDVKVARRQTIKASKRFRVKVIEGSYKTKETIFHTKKTDYALVRRGDKVIGRLELASSRFKNSSWSVVDEERR